MQAKVKPGRYALAVSGGVDSMALLDILADKPGIDLVVAHFNHGIRRDSSKDEKLVRAAAADHGLELEVGYGRLGAGASEDTARKARYDFLNEVKKRHKASRIITAHHQDDLIETAILNMLRGTGARGLSAMLDNDEIVRPLLGVPKSQIIDYAKQKKINWCEDPSNRDLSYLRNYIRHKIMPKLSSQQRQELLKNIDKIAKSSRERRELLSKLTKEVRLGQEINRQAFAALPLEIERELIAFWLNDLKVTDVDRKTIERLALTIKTAPAGTAHSVRGALRLVVGTKNAHFDTSVE